MAGSYASLYYHLVFSTKDRLPLITPDVAPRIYEYMGGIIRSQGGISLRIGGTADHAHVLTTIDKTLAIADCLRDLKCNTTNWIKETFPWLQSFAWQEGYGAFTISVSGLNRVKAYIDGQTEHHRTVTFQEEFLDFLHRHNIPYDPRYIWL
ncbi:MAG TPA: transposase [Armatimonadota bacterium]|jgi:REP element-mobilizing transposase RayT